MWTFIQIHDSYSPVTEGSQQHLCLSAHLQTRISTGLPSGSGRGLNVVIYEAPKENVTAIIKLGGGRCRGRIGERAQRGKALAAKIW